MPTAICPALGGTTVVGVASKKLRRDAVMA